MRTLKTIAIVAAFAALPACAAKGAVNRSNDGRRALEQADLLVTTGRLEEALPLYDMALASPELTMPERASALYATAMLRLSSGPLRDVEKARTVLQDLNTNYPTTRRLEVVAALSLMTQIDETERARAEAAATRDRAEAARTEAERARTGSQQTMTDSLRSAEAGRAAAQRELAAANEQLAGLQAELKRKDDALKRLTQRVLK